MSTALRCNDNRSKICVSLVVMSAKTRIYETSESATASQTNAIELRVDMGGIILTEYTIVNHNMDNCRQNEWKISLEINSLPPDHQSTEILVPYQPEALFSCHHSYSPRVELRGWLPREQDQNDKSHPNQRISKGEIEYYERCLLAVVLQKSINTYRRVFDVSKHTFINSIQSSCIDPEVRLDWPMMFPRDIRNDTCTCRPVDVASKRVRCSVELDYGMVKSANDTDIHPVGPSCWLWKPE